MPKSCNTGLAGGPSRLDLRDPAQRLPDLIALVEGTGADIVGLQEVTSRHRAAVESGLGHLYELYDGGDAANADVILLAKDAFTVREQAVDSFTSGCRAPIRVTSLVAETATGRTFAVVNTHLCARDPAANVEQLGEVLAWHLGDMPVVLTGDLTPARAPRLSTICWASAPRNRLYPSRFSTPGACRATRSRSAKLAPYRSTGSSSLTVAAWPSTSPAPLP